MPGKARPQGADSTTQDTVPAVQQEPAPEELEPTPAPPAPVLARATVAFVVDELDMVPGDEPRELQAHVFDRLAALGLVERV